jgi:nicotinate-nucleotide adenylyltransferase
MRTAFFGGSFDPPHLGHLAIARAAAARLALDYVLMAPVGTQPLKSDLKPASFSDRLAMVELATSGDPTLVVSLADAPRVDGKPNYTVDTLGQLRQSLGAGDKLFFLLGADSFLTLRKWDRSEELLRLADFIVAGRPGFVVDGIAAALPSGWGVDDDRLVTRPQGDYRKYDVSRDGEAAAIYVLGDLREDISATEIRAALASDAQALSLLPPQVVDYIRVRGLYR